MARDEVAAPSSALPPARETSTRRCREPPAACPPPLAPRSAEAAGVLAEGRAGDVVDGPAAAEAPGTGPAGAAPDGVLPSALDGSPAGGATGAEEASTRTSEAMRSRSERIVFRCTSAAPPSATSLSLPWSLPWSARLEVPVPSLVVAERAASAAPGSALRDTASPPVDPARGSAANRGSARRGTAGEAARLAASGLPEGAASADRCTDGVPLLAPADGVPGAEVEVGAALACADGAAGDAGVALVDGVVVPDGEAAGDDAPVAGAPLGRTGRPGVAPRGSITSGVPAEGDAAARRALSASTIEAMPCRISLLAPSDGAPPAVDGRATGGDTPRLTVASEDEAAGGGVLGAGELAEASTTRCTDEEAAEPVLDGAPPLGVSAEDGRAASARAVEGDAGGCVALGEVGAEGATPEAAADGARNPKAGGASGAVRASPGRASRIRGVSAPAELEREAAASAMSASAIRATSPSTARWMPGGDASALAAPGASLALTPLAVGAADAPGPSALDAGAAPADPGTSAPVASEVVRAADGAGRAPADGRAAGASLVKRSAASTERATCSVPPLLRGLDDPPPASTAPVPPVLPIEKRGARSSACGGAAVGEED